MHLSPLELFTLGALMSTPEIALAVLCILAAGGIVYLVMRRPGGKGHGGHRDHGGRR